MKRASFLLSLGLLTSSSFVVMVACGGAVDSSSANTNDPRAPASSASDPVSPPRSAGGSSANAGGDNSSSGATCTAQCDAGDRSGATQSEVCKEITGLIRCYEREACGQKVWCAGYAPPCPYPTCPDGYATVPDAGACPPNGDCVPAVGPNGSVCTTPVMCFKSSSDG